MEPCSVDFIRGVVSCGSPSTNRYQPSQWIKVQSTGGLFVGTTGFTILVLEVSMLPWPLPMPGRLFADKRQMHLCPLCRHLQFPSYLRSVSHVQELCFTKVPMPPILATMPWDRFDNVACWVDKIAGSPVFTVAATFKAAQASQPRRPGQKPRYDLTQPVAWTGHPVSTWPPSLC